MFVVVFIVYMYIHKLFHVLCVNMARSLGQSHPLPMSDGEWENSDGEIQDVNDDPLDRVQGKVRQHVIAVANK